MYRMCKQSVDRTRLKVSIALYHAAKWWLYASTRIGYSTYCKVDLASSHDVVQEGIHSVKLQNREEAFKLIPRGWGFGLGRVLINVFRWVPVLTNGCSIYKRTSMYLKTIIQPHLSSYALFRKQVLCSKHEHEGSSSVMCSVFSPCQLEITRPVGAAEDSNWETAAITWAGVQETN